MEFDFIISCVWTILFVFIIIFTTFQPMRLSAFFGCFLLNSGAYIELPTKVGTRIELETPEKDRRIHRLKGCEYKNKDEENSPNTLNKQNYL